MSPTSRRRILKTSAGLLSIGFSGCATSVPSGSTSSTESNRTDENATGTSGFDDGESLPAASCDGENVPFEPFYVVSGPGPIGGAELSVETTSLTRGETFRATLRNTTYSSITIGDRNQVDVQRETDAGWRSIFGAKRQPEWETVGYDVWPGEIYSWELSFTRSGIPGVFGTDGKLVVCDDLEPGSYRFVYWGVSGNPEATENSRSNYAVGAPFRVETD